MPSFLYPAFLIGAAAAAIPLLLHLLRNQQAPELRFSAVRLLRGVRVEQAQRRRIRDWLLLALRVSALLLLAIAFARPYVAADSPRAGQITILVVDRSASMSVPAAWERAKSALRKAADATASREAIGLIAFDDKPDLIVEPTLDRGAIRAAIDRLRPAAGGTRYPAAVARAVSLLEDSDRGTGRVVLVSDLQGSPADARITIPESVAFDVIAAAAPFENIALLGARETARGVLATIRNDGAAPRQVRVEVSRADLAAPAAVSVDIPPGQSIEAALATPWRAGDARVRVIAPDGNSLGSDDERYVRLGAARRPRVLLIASAADAFYVDAALRAGEPAADFESAIVNAAGATQALAAARPDVVFVLGPRGLDRGAREALLRYARNGGGVLVAASDPGFSLLLEGVEVSAPRGDDAVVALAAFDTRHPLFQRHAAIGDSLADARFTRAWRVKADGWQTIARFDDGAGALYERAEGRGRILFFASDLNRGWNDLPVQPAFVPFIQETARYLAPREERREYTPGTLPAGVPAAPGFVQFPDRQVIVNPDVRESDPARMDAALFKAAVKRRPDRQADQAVRRRRVETTERNQALWRYGLMLMFATLAVEGIVASRVRRV